MVRKNKKQRSRKKKNRPRSEDCEDEMKNKEYKRRKQELREDF